MTIVGASVFDTRIISDGAGGMFAVRVDTRNSATGYDIYAQRIDANGRPLWTINGVEVCRLAGTQTLPLIAADAAGGVVIVWQDHRVFNDGRSHLFAQRLDGNCSPLWTPNGVRVSTSAASQHSAVIAARAGGGAVVAWNDERGSPSITTTLVARPEVHPGIQIITMAGGACPDVVTSKRFVRIAVAGQAGVAF